MKTVALVLTVAALTAPAGVARADDWSSPGFNLALTLGEGVYFVDGDVYREQVSFEVVPSFGWSWFRFDLGLMTMFESFQVADTNLGNWNFTFRPGGRVTPPMAPVYFRFAFPLELQRHDFNYGVLFGGGLDIRVIPVLGIMFEINTTLTSELEYGRRGVPLEFRLGVNFHF
ncbi:MAG: hypothetical protein JXB32_10710 [Deltaproteobacteria bacterium]|nr:hypothetical protein [Deltaproteobacteria bacterium]